MSMPISSEAGEPERSETIPQGSTTQACRKRPAPNNWGDDIVRSSWKREAVLKTLVNNLKISDKGCWEWQGATSVGYGSFRIEEIYGNFKILAHRASWVAFKGEPIPDGLFVCHHCDNPLCFNPDHLFLGTQKDNLMDCSAKGRTLTGARSYTSKYTREDIDEVKTLLAEGKTGRKISEITGVSPSHVSRIRRGYTWRRDTEGAAKTYNANRKYTDEQLIKAGDLIATTNLSNVKIAGITGIHKCTVSDMRTGKLHQRFMRRSAK